MGSNGDLDKVVDIFTSQLKLSRDEIGNPVVSRIYNGQRRERNRTTNQSKPWLLKVRLQDVDMASRVISASIKESRNGDSGRDVQPDPLPRVFRDLSRKERVKRRKLITDAEAKT